MSLNTDEFKNEIFHSKLIKFDELALRLFSYQHEHNAVLQEFVSHAGLGMPQHAAEISFLPVDFFKTHHVVSGSFDPDAVFTSSGTTGSGASRHLVKDLSLYEGSYLQAFRMFYGEPADYCILAMLPSYMEREGSSLVYMAEALVS
jgi:hypothetical protein